MKHSNLSELPRTKALAVAMGVSYYFTGVACKNGHTYSRGLSGNCVLCSLAHKAKVRDPVKRKAYYEANRERERETNKAYMVAHAERLTFVRSAYAERHREEARARNADWRSRNADYGARHRAENPHLYRIYKHNRRQREAGDSLSLDIVDRLMSLQGGKCACCAKPLSASFHLDHIKPLARGGRNVDANVQLLRKRCNLVKSWRDPIDYMQSQGKLL